MNTRLDSKLEEIARPLLLELMHAIEDLTARKPVGQLADSDDVKLLDYLFMDGLYPIEDDRDYAELGGVFTEDE